ncbi:MAG: methylmalonyl-CoA mutase subunit beta [Bacteroidales bacterium]|nr:methylmalonyl-CoA mutase subunit beta [Bacteroidales bacterium]
MSEKKLFAEFPPVSTAQWEEVITRDLKGADYEKRLVWRTSEGFNVRPYYRSADLENLQYLHVMPGDFPFVRGGKVQRNAWEICQEFDVECESETNAKAVEAVEGGVTALAFNFSKKGQKREIKMQGLLKDIDLGQVAVTLDGGVNDPDMLRSLLAVADEKKVREVRAAVRFDPLGSLACRGHYYGQSEFPLDTLKQLLSDSADCPRVRVIGVDAAQFQDAGATLVQEMGIALSMGAEYLTRLTDAGCDAARTAGKMVFRFAVGPVYFMEIAKIRAARMLWAHLVRAYAPDADVCMYIHARTASLNATVYDPYVNLLRSATESMSAVIGGADMLSVLPFDQAYKQPDDFSLRLARNQQVILKEESNFDKVVDPSAGSYYIESLTASMADEAWKIFLQIQDAGGFVAAMQAGMIQNMVAESAKKRLAAMASRKEVLLGTNQYANPIEFAKDKFAAMPEHTCCGCAEPIVTPVRPIRLAAAYEALRRQTEESAHARPKVFMLTIGDLKMRKARAGFATNFFAVAGYEVIDNNGFESIAAGMEAAEKAKADIVVLCSSDDEYPLYAAEAVAAAKGRFLLVLAGYPKALLEQLQQAGIDHFIYAGQNVLEALQSYQKELGI